MAEVDPIALSRADAAATCGGISQSTFKRLVAAGKLPPPIKLGTRSVWLRKDLEAALRRLSAVDWRGEQ